MRSAAAPHAKCGVALRAETTIVMSIRALLLKACPPLPACVR
jgi:hypothetical protein